MGNTFRIGRRFRKIKYLCVAANALVVFTFYFIYRYLFQSSFPEFVDAPLALIFLLIGLAVVRVTLWFADKYAQSISYQVTAEGLVITQGRAVRTILWTDFRGARLRTVQFQGPFPVEFQTGEETILLNQYVDELYVLTDEVFQHIRGHAAIAPELEEQARAMRGVY